VSDVLKEGEEVMVKVIEIDKGRVKLSRREAMREERARTETAATDVSS
jgi:polyribonucleotide nucleotidyltransferase